MGSLAQRYADEVILTDDNPRNESPVGIVKDILAGVSHTTSMRVVHDRKQAIAAAINAAQCGDVVLIAGKGHERMQISGGQLRPFSDQHEVLAQLKRATP
jgi:UDP-N-acetylmuramoyl-L-alanyl-D-glutamate--2,6-diaminopimelate ligase